ncbi:MAG: hypothetical protein WCG09_05035 [Halobacteriota archaeon]
MVIRKLQKNGKTYHGPSRDGIDNEPLDVALLYLQRYQLRTPRSGGRQNSVLLIAIT